MDNPIVGCPGLGEPQTRDETPPKKPEEEPKSEPRKHTHTRNNFKFEFSPQMRSHETLIYVKIHNTLFGIFLEASIDFQNSQLQNLLGISIIVKIKNKMTSQCSN